LNDTGTGNDANATAVGAWIEKPTLNPVNIFDHKVLFVVQGFTLMKQGEMDSSKKD
jgi:hypothetical protein